MFPNNKKLYSHCDLYIKCISFVTETGGVCNNAEAGYLSAFQEPPPLQ